MLIYMQYEGVKGDATATGYQGMIQLDFFVFGMQRNIVTHAGRAMNRESGLPTVNAIQTGKKLDGSTTGILQETFSSRAKKVIFHFVRTGQGQSQQYMTFTLHNSIPVFYQFLAMNRPNGVPVERLYLNGTAFAVSYSGSGVDDKLTGPKRYGYDIAMAKSV
ncbi:MAG: type VI secretion system tube protein Hcp [Gammaproteobacteria bacterium]|nr:type VI secretion system tube protein Hcp [Gammaproteobacteria bacterium]